MVEDVLVVDHNFFTNVHDQRPWRGKRLHSVGEFLDIIISSTTISHGVFESIKTHSEFVEALLNTLSGLFLKVFNSVSEIFECAVSVSDAL